MRLAAPKRIERGEPAEHADVRLPEIARGDSLWGLSRTAAKAARVEKPAAKREGPPLPLFVPGKADFNVRLYVLVVRVRRT